MTGGFDDIPEPKNRKLTEEELDKLINIMVSYVPVYGYQHIYSFIKQHKSIWRQDKQIIIAGVQKEVLDAPVH